MQRRRNCILPARPALWRFCCEGWWSKGHGNWQWGLQVEAVQAFGSPWPGHRHERASSGLKLMKGKGNRHGRGPHESRSRPPLSGVPIRSRTAARRGHCARAFAGLTASSDPVDHRRGGAASTERGATWFAVVHPSFGWYLQTRPN